MHQDRIWFGQLQSLVIDGKEAGIFADRWVQGFLLTFQLDSEPHDNIGAPHSILHRRADDRRCLVEVFRQHGAGGRHADPGAHFLEGPQVAPGYPAVQQVADNCHLQTLEAAFVLAHREQVQ